MAFHSWEFTNPLHSPKLYRGESQDARPGTDQDQQIIDTLCIREKPAKTVGELLGKPCGAGYR